MTPPSAPVDPQDAAYLAAIRAGAQKGVSRSAIRRQLISRHGVSSSRADGLLEKALGPAPEEPEAETEEPPPIVYIRRHRAAEPMPGWVWWLFALILINVLSAVFNWRFWVY